MLTLLICARSGFAATLTVVADQSTYLPGDTITLTVVGSIDPTSELAPHIDVRLELPANVSFVTSSADTAQTPPCMFGPCIWTVGAAQGTLTGNSLRLFDQTCTGCGVFVNNWNGVGLAFITATAVLTAISPGSDVPLDFGLLTDFFGISGASPGTTVHIVPEPTTSALMGLGVVVLALRRRLRGELARVPVTRALGSSLYPPRPPEQAISSPSHAG